MNEINLMYLTVVFNIVMWLMCARFMGIAGLVGSMAASLLYFLLMY